MDAVPACLGIRRQTVGLRELSTIFCAVLPLFFFVTQTPTKMEQCWPPCATHSMLIWVIFRSDNNSTIYILVGSCCEIKFEIVSKHLAALKLSLRYFGKQEYNKDAIEIHQKVCINVHAEQFFGICRMCKLWVDLKYIKV